MAKPSPTDHLSDDQKWQQIEAGLRDAISKPRYAARLTVDLFRSLRSLLEKSGVSISGDDSSVKIAELKEELVNQGALVTELIGKVSELEKAASAAAGGAAVATTPESPVEVKPAETKPAASNIPSVN